MGAIFLSYAREDRACAKVLARVLEAVEYEVWWDQHIDSGEEFAAEIEAALDKADIVLVAWSKESIKSRWVRDEASVGGDTGRLVPVSIDGSLPPMGFRQFHTLDLTGWKGARRDERSAELLHSVARRLEAKGKAAPAARAAEPKRRFVWPMPRRLWAIAASLMLVIAVAAVIFISNRGQPSGPAPKPTFALQPFTAASSDAALRDVAEQVRDSIAHTLSQSGVPIRRLSAVPQGRAPGDFLMSGELSRNAGKLVATVRVDEVAHGVTIFSQQFEAAGDDARNLPERVGVQIAGNLALAARQFMMDKRFRSDPALMADFLGQANSTGNDLQSYQSSQRVAAKAPDSGYAQLSLAFRTSFVLWELPRQERADALIAARRAAERAQALVPKFGDVYAPWCFLHSETRRVECENRLRAARRVDPDAPFLNSFLSHILRAVGRFDEAVEVTRLSYSHDPYVPTKIGFMLRMLEFTGERDEAQTLYQQGVLWWPEYKDMFFRNRLFGLLDRGDFEAVRRLEEDVGAKGLPAGYRDSGALVAALHSKSPAGVKQACAGGDAPLAMFRCMLAFATVGDQDSAFALADKLYPTRVGRTPAETERIWLDDPDGPLLEFITSPAAAPMRRDPRYLALAQRVGLLNYWRSGRPPDFCRNQPEPICAQLLKRSR